MLKGVYADDFYNIKLKVIRNSRLTFICAIPIWMEERFITKTKKAIGVLIIRGIVSIAVGGIEIMNEYIPGKRSDGRLQIIYIADKNKFKPRA